MHGHGVKTDPHDNLFEGEWRDGKPLLKDKQQGDRCGALRTASRAPPECTCFTLTLTCFTRNSQQPDGLAQRDGWQRERPSPT